MGGLIRGDTRTKSVQKAHTNILTAKRAGPGKVGQDFVIAWG
jgi:hypothetical protein